MFAVTTNPAAAWRKWRVASSCWASKCKQIRGQRPGAVARWRLDGCGKSGGERSLQGRGDPLDCAADAQLAIRELSKLVTLVGEEQVLDRNVAFSGRRDDLFCLLGWHCLAKRPTAQRTSEVAASCSANCSRRRPT